MAFLAITLLSIAQVVWWVYDQSRYSKVQTEARMELYREQEEAARDMLDAGIPAAEVERLMVHVDVKGGVPEIDAGDVAELLEERRAHLNQYRWEGGFFLVVLLAAIGIVWRALARDFELRRWQENFLAAVSHELKSPLASLQLAAETLALRDLRPERRRQVVQRILADAKRLGVTISNVLDTHRLDRGEAIHRPEALDLQRAVELAVEDVEFRASESGVQLKVDVPAARIRADVQSVRSVLRNLLDNALKAHSKREEDGGSILVRGRVEADSVILEVRDDGVGFPPEEADRLFSKFYRLGEEMRRTTIGSGLGLHLARSLVELDGGTLRAHSDGPGQGATFTVSWPRADAVPH